MIAPRRMWNDEAKLPCEEQDEKQHSYFATAQGSTITRRSCKLYIETILSKEVDV